MPRKPERKPAKPAKPPKPAQPVKAAPSRRQRALVTRQRMRDAAYAAFCELGYRATTMNEVGRRAGVAVQTVYFTFHTKAALLTDVVVELSAGPDAGTPVMERAWVKAALTTRDAQHALALLVEHGTDIFRRMAPLWDTMVAAAAEDPEFASRFAEIIGARRRGMKRLIEAIAARGGLKAGADRVAATLFLIQSPQLLALATASLGWSVEHFKAWSFSILLQFLTVPAWRPSTTAGLSFHAELATL